MKAQIKTTNVSPVLVLERLSQRPRLTMTIKKTILTLLALISHGARAASSLCFNDKASYEAVKTRLPKVLQTTPFVLVSNDWKVTGGIKTDFVGDKIQLTGTYITARNAFSSASSYADRICVEDSLISVKTEGRDYRIQAKGDQFSVTTPDGTANFAASTVAGYTAITQKARGMNAQQMKSFANRDGLQ